MMPEFFLPIFRATAGMRKAAAKAAMLWTVRAKVNIPIFCAT